MEIKENGLKEKESGFCAHAPLEGAENIAPRFAIHTLGCRVNTYESDAMAEALRHAGFSERAFSETADVYIVNTCTVTNIADRKSRQMLHRAKKQNPDALIVAAGCYVDAAMQNEAMQAVLKDAAIDLLIPNKHKAQIASLIRAALLKRRGDQKAVAGTDAYATDPAASATFDDPAKTADFANTLNPVNTSNAADAGRLFVTELDGHTRAFVKVQDGCNQFCSYCIIPYVRGRISSRPVEDCIAEIRRLSENGVREVVLTGIHLSSYGRDFSAYGENAESLKALSPGSRVSDDICNTADAPLLSLLRAVQAIDGIARIRMGSLEPRLMSEEFVAALSEMPKVCPHFHLSLQSGCAKTLRSMNRHYTPDEYREVCARLRRYYGHPAITTDVIAGFPGETEADFEESRRLIEEIGFYELHVFKYSRRAGTRADRMEGQVPEAVKEARSRVLLSLAEEMSHAYRSSLLGKKVEMLCEETVQIGGKTYAAGYSREYVRCLLEGGNAPKNAILTGTALETFKEKHVYESLILR